MSGQAGFYIYTFGCQMNDRDSQIMSHFLRAEGMIPAESPDDSQVIILNTCHIREHAEQRALSLLGRLRPWRTTGSGRILALAGCVAEALKGTGFIQFPHLDIIIGPSELPRLPALVKAARNGAGRKQLAVGHERGRCVPEINDGSGEGFRVGVKVMEGCGHACSFCVVPAVRGPARSRPFGEVVAQAEKLAAGGAKEICLLGQAVNFYRDNQTRGGDFPALLRRLDRIDGLLRIRFISSHPAHISDELFRAMADCEKVCEHLHLPVQSGSDAILKLMKRGYTSGSYLKLLMHGRRIIPNLSVTTDIIVGFPGETEEDFVATLGLVESAGFDAGFAFKYSARPGTPARQMPDQVPEKIKEERLARLNQVLEIESRKSNDSLIGLNDEILVEHVSPSGEKLNGRLRNNKLVHVQGKTHAKEVGELARIVICGAGGHSLQARAASEADA